MEQCGYKVKAQLINAKYLGVPQSRERIIFVGVRNDIGIMPCFPKPYNYIVPLGNALKNITNDEKEIKQLIEDANKYKWGEILKKISRNQKKPISGASVANGSYFNLIRESLYAPCSTICQATGDSSTAGNCHPVEDRKFTIAELKRITSVPDDFVLTGTFAQRWERLGRMVPPIMMREISRTIKENILDKL